MRVLLTGDAERIRNANKKPPKTWEHLITENLVEAVHTARDLGWGQKKVQVKAIRTGEDIYTYFVEPFEGDCRCPGILKYSDYFLPGTGE